MTLKLLPVLVAILACALWPQGLVLCMGDEGHVELELNDAGCCPSETDDGCVDCADFAAPDQQSFAPIVSIGPPLMTGVRPLCDPDRLADPTATATLRPPPRDGPLEGVLLLV